MDIKKIMVIGAGQMGAGIAQVCAASGYTVYLNDLEQAFIDKGLARIEKNLSKQVSKERITQEDLKGTMDRLTSNNRSAGCEERRHRH